MATEQDNKSKAEQGNAANVKVDVEHAHDRVAMLSLKADGTPDQTAPEIIGDKEWAVAAAKEQFAQQAVSAADEKRAREAAAVSETAVQDPTIKAAQDEHGKVAEAAEKTAESVVDALFKG